MEHAHARRPREDEAYRETPPALRAVPDDLTPEERRDWQALAERRQRRDRREQARRGDPARRPQPQGSGPPPRRSARAAAEDLAEPFPSPGDVATRTRSDVAGVRSPAGGPARPDGRAAERGPAPSGGPARTASNLNGAASATVRARPARPDMRRDRYGATEAAGLARRASGGRHRASAASAVAAPAEAPAVPAAPRRTVDITGQTAPGRSRPSRRPRRSVGAGPDRLALWAVVLCLFMALVAAATARGEAPDAAERDAVQAPVAAESRR